jgi:hypothetical protein
MTSIVAALILLVVLLVAVWVIAPRRGSHATAIQRLIRALYLLAAWFQDLAIAIDRGYLAYRMERALNEIEPENERWGGAEWREPESEAAA